MKHAIGIWCGLPTAELTPEVHGVSMLRLTIKRVGIPKESGVYALIPWTKDYDWLEAEVKAWKACPLRRCHPNEFLAMRDLVVEHSSDIGAIVQGSCASIDRAEVQIALAKTFHNYQFMNEQKELVVGYISRRIRAMKAVSWLGYSDSNEWCSPLSAQELRSILPAGNLEARMDELKARK